MNSNVQQEFYRNGQIREQTSLDKGRRHGVARTWHKNGVLATEEFYQNDLLHGVCRQWNETGKLLGKYRMVHGTGVQRAWHDNGRLQMEVSTVKGEFCGRNRIWLRDGTLLSERFYLNGRVVSAKKYREAAEKDGTLPAFREKPASVPPDNATRTHIHRVFVDSLLEKSNRVEARDWLRKKAGGKTARSLGRFKHETDAAKFVEAIYQAGATEVVVPDIYDNKSGDQFSDALLVRLPESPTKRKAVRAICAQLRTRELGAVLPERDIGETHLFLSMA